jgi:epoxyqueuosine reductase QueG
MDSDKSVLSRELKKFSQDRGADLFGVADLTPAHDFIVSQGGSQLEKFPRAVSIGLQVSDLIVENHNPNETRRQSLYWHHVYNVVTPALDFLAYDVTRWLTKRGFRALPIPGSTPYNFEKLLGIFSHKLAAHLAGLGWIGKSCLLLTDRFGPRARFVSVLTDAPLETGQTLDKSCGKCHVCVDACPAKAFTGEEFRPSDGREVRFDVFKCSEYRKDNACGLCVSTCPVGHPQARQRKTKSQAP